METVILFVTVTVFALIYVKFVEPTVPNYALVKCVACGSKMYSRPKGVGAFISCLVWNLATYQIVWRTEPPMLVGAALVLLIATPFMMASNRIYHAYWRYRHPLRCGEGGHLKPAPTPT